MVAALSVNIVTLIMGDPVFLMATNVKKIVLLTAQQMQNAVNQMAVTINALDLAKQAILAQLMVLVLIHVSALHIAQAKLVEPIMAVDTSVPDLVPKAVFVKTIRNYIIVVLALLTAQQTQNAEIVIVMVAEEPALDLVHPIRHVLQMAPADINVFVNPTAKINLAAAQPVAEEPAVVPVPTKMKNANMFRLPHLAVINA